MQGIINIKGKQYVTVAERVRLAHAEREAFEVVESAPFELAGRVLWRAVIRVNGKQYVGTAEVKLNASKNLPDGTNPFECGETSAVGRALGFAGLGAIESIASAEEVIQAIAEQEHHTPRHDPDKPATEQQIQTICKLQKELGNPSEPDMYDGFTFGDAAQMLQDLNKRLQNKRKAS
jgi:hypothetical protein